MNYFKIQFLPNKSVYIYNYYILDLLSDFVYPYSLENKPWF